MTPLLLVVAAGFALLFMVNRGLFDLGVLMFRIDLFAFGGGFASVPLMYHEIVDVRSWMDGETFMNGIALGQVTPGPIVITATFVGYLLYGIAGAVVATVSVFLPSFLMVVGVVPYFDRLRASDHFNRCMSGILASFVGLLLSVTIQFALDVPWDAPRIVLAGVSLVALLLQRGRSLGRSGGRCSLSGDLLAARLDQHLPHTAMVGLLPRKVQVAICVQTNIYYHIRLSAYARCQAENGLEVECDNLASSGQSCKESIQW